MRPLRSRSSPCPAPDSRDPFYAANENNACAHASRPLRRERRSQTQSAMRQPSVGRGTRRLHSRSSGCARCAAATLALDEVQASPTETPGRSPRLTGASVSRALGGTLGVCPQQACARAPRTSVQAGESGSAGRSARQPRSLTAGRAGRESRLIGVTIPAAPFARGRLGLRVTFRAVCAYRPAGARPNVFSRTATAVSALSANRPSTPSL